ELLRSNVLFNLIKAAHCLSNGAHRLIAAAGADAALFAQIGAFDPDAALSLYWRLSHDISSPDDHSRAGLHLSDYRGPAAERKSGGPGGRLWRHGVADRIRTAGVGDTALQGDDRLGGRVHGHLAVAFDSGDA